MTKWPGMGDDVKGTLSYMISGMVVYDASAMYDSALSTLSLGKSVDELSSYYRKVLV